MVCLAAMGQTRKTVPEIGGARFNIQQPHHRAAPGSSPENSGFGSVGRKALNHCLFYRDYLIKVDKAGSSRESGPRQLGRSGFMRFAI